MNATLPIHGNVIFVCDNKEIDGEKLVAFFTNTSSRQPVLFHNLVLFSSEVVEPTIPLDIVTHILEIQGTYIQNGFIPLVDLDEELAGLQQMCMEKLRIQSCKK